MHAGAKFVSPGLGGRPGGPPALLRLLAAGAALVCGGAPAVIAQAAVAGPVRAAALAPVRWRIVTTFSGHFPAARAVAAPSAADLWVMGVGALRPGGRGFPIGRHWNGRSWSPVTFPKAIRTTGIGCAGASAPSNVWAFAGADEFGNGASAAGALRLKQGRWVIVKMFPPGLVSGCLVIGPSEVWVFGDSHVAPGTGTWHLHGRTWTHLRTAGMALARASAVGPDDVWGLGEDDFGHARVARWNGTSWVSDARVTRGLPRPLPLTFGAGGITAISAGDVWLGLPAGRFPGTRIVVFHWNGSRWRKVSSSSPGFYLPFAVHSRSGWWADTAFLPHGSVLHRVAGRWVKVPVRIAGCPQLPFQLAPVRRSPAVLGLQGCLTPAQTANVLAHGPLP